MKLSRHYGDQPVVLNSAVAASVTVPPVDIGQLYETYAGFLGRVITKLVGDGPQVDDLLQETFIVAFNKRETLFPEASPRGWLYSIAANLCRRYRRSAGRSTLFRQRLARQALSPQAEAGPEGVLERRRAAQLVNEVLQQLSFKHREVFVLYELEELEGNEIAETLGIPLGTVWTRLHHGRKRFQRLLRTRLQPSRCKAIPGVAP